MSLFWSEFLFFATSMFGILVAYSVSSLFYQTLRAEHHEKTIWRAIGFFVLMSALVLFVLERKYGSFGLLGVILEAIAFFLIYRGVLAQPRLSLLTKVRKVDPDDQSQFTRHLWSHHVRRWLVHTLIVLDVIAILAVVLWLIVHFISPTAGSSVIHAVKSVAVFFRFLSPYLASTVILVSLWYILKTIRLQIRRYRDENASPEVRHNNLYPLIGFLFFIVREISLAGYRLPKIDLVWTRFFNGEYSTAWIVAAIATALGFLFLAFWAWRFIRVRFFLRTYVVFLTLSIAVATISVLIFSLLIFQVVETNNLELMARGAKTESLIMVERKNVAETIARLLAEGSRVTSGSAEYDPEMVSEHSEFFRQHTNVDVIRFFSPQREVVSSPTDGRDVGRVFSEDTLLLKAVDRGTATSSFDVVPGVLSSVVVGRALHPLSLVSWETVPASGSERTDIASSSATVSVASSSAPVVAASSSEVLGIVEVAYAFDNAFVDYSKRETGLEVTIYNGKERAASTIRTADGTSRWVGSNETEPAVLTHVLERGEEYQTSLDRLGIPYYSAFEPIRDVSGTIIGMVSVGVPTHILLEESRQRLLSSFFVATFISLIAAIAGFFAFRNFAREDRES